MNDGVLRMRRLIDDLLAYTSARDAALSIDTVDLSALVNDVVATRLETLKPNLASDERPNIYVGVLPHVEADVVLLRQVLDNFIGNALKYSQPDAAAHIDVSSSTRDGEVRIEVADRGLGIPRGEHSLIFGRFFRAHTETGLEGTGLGLAICQRAIERHGGQIGVTDNPGGGARFFFTLPIVPAEVERPESTLVGTAAAS